MSDSRIRVLVVDDHDMVRSGLAVFLRAFDDLELVGEAADGADAIRACDALEPDVVLMDLMMPVLDGPAAIQAIRQAHPRIQIVALTSFTDEDMVRGALRAGAIGYLLKNATIDDLAAAVRAAHAGRPTLSPEALRGLLSERSEPAVASYNLSDREREVLALLVEGRSNSEIARRLTLGRSTVKTHVSNVLAKLGVANRVGAATLAIDLGLVSRPRPPSSAS